jgi:hypothetical protein
MFIAVRAKATGSEAATAAELQGRFRRRPGTGRNLKWYLFAPGRVWPRDKIKRINYDCCRDPEATRAIAGTSGKRSKSWEDPPTRNAHRDNGWKRRFDQEIAQIRV